MRSSASLNTFLSLLTGSLIAGCSGAGSDSAEDAPYEAIDSSTQALTLLGGLDLNQQCRRQHGASAAAVLLQPVHSPGAAYAWRCRVYGFDYSIDMQLFCRWQYGYSNIFGAYTDFNNAYSWNCYLP